MTNILEPLSKLPLSQLHKNNYTHIKNAYDRVMWCLYHHPETRNSDKVLAWAFWETFESTTPIEDMLGAEQYISFENFEKNTAYSTIKRVRAYIQNNKRIFVPTDENVARARSMLDKSWARIMKKDLSGRKRI